MRERKWISRSFLIFPGYRTKLTVIIVLLCWLFRFSQPSWVTTSNIFVIRWNFEKGQKSDARLTGLRSRNVWWCSILGDIPLIASTYFSSARWKWGKDATTGAPTRGEEKMLAEQILFTSAGSQNKQIILGDFICLRFYILIPLGWTHFEFRSPLEKVFIFSSGDLNIGYTPLLLPFDVESYQGSRQEIAVRTTLAHPPETRCWDMKHHGTFAARHATRHSAAIFQNKQWIHEVAPFGKHIKASIWYPIKTKCFSRLVPSSNCECRTWCYNNRSRSVIVQEHYGQVALKVPAILHKVTLLFGRTWPPWHSCCGWSEVGQRWHFSYLCLAAHEGNKHLRPLERREQGHDCTQVHNCVCIFYIDGVNYARPGAYANPPRLKENTPAGWVAISSFTFFTTTRGSTLY